MWGGKGRGRAGIGYIILSEVVACDVILRLLGSLDSRHMQRTLRGYVGWVRGRANWIKFYHGRLPGQSPYLLATLQPKVSGLNWLGLLLVAIMRA